MDNLTDSNLVKLTDFIFKGMDKGFQASIIRDDPQNTFYALDHTVLLQEMEFIDFNESVIKILASLKYAFPNTGLINFRAP